MYTKKNLYIQMGYFAKGFVLMNYLKEQRRNTKGIVRNVIRIKFRLFNQIFDDLLITKKQVINSTRLC